MQFCEFTESGTGYRGRYDDSGSQKSDHQSAAHIPVFFFDNVRNFNAESYAKLFAVSPDDKALIDAINSTYSLEINYEDFMRSYTFVMNATINQYMFSDSKKQKCRRSSLLGQRMRTSQAGATKGRFFRRQGRVRPNQICRQRRLDIGISQV